jgi:hypothetical protein
MTSGPPVTTHQRFRSLAAANHADWCDSVAHANGVPTSRTGGLWWATEATPNGFPEAITLGAGLDSQDVLAALEHSPAAVSITDSFADLDFSYAGFRIVFDAEWIARPSSTAGRTPLLTWHTISSPAELNEWAGGHGKADALNASLLGLPDLYLLGAYRDDTLLGGAVANVSRGTAGSSVVGISNVFALEVSLEVVWQDLVTLTGLSLPGLPLVGWEVGDNLLPALAARFDVVGALRVWRGLPQASKARTRGATSVP